MKFTILKQGLLLVAVPLLSQLVFIALLARTQHENAEADAWSLHTKEVMAQCHALMTAMVEAESAARGWVISNDRQFVELCAKAQSEVLAKLARLESMVQDNPPQVTRCKVIAEQSKAMLAWQGRLGKLVGDGKRETAARMVAEGHGRQLMATMRGLAADFLAIEESLDTTRMQSVAAMRERLNWFLLGGALTAIAITAALAVLLVRGIGRRLTTMIDNAARFSQGRKLHGRVAGSDEIARLDRVFHEMAHALSQAADKERAYTETLERRVAERTEQLEGINRDLRHKNQENETFVYSVSHDLRSPLVNLQGFSRELSYACTDLAAVGEQVEMPPAVRQRFSSLIERDMTESIDFIQNAVTRLSNIIDALLRLSRIGRIEYQWQQVDVEVTLRRVVASLQSTSQQRQASMVVGDLPSAWGDPTALEQIFANLVGNALNYLSPDRPGVIEIGLADSGDETVNTYFVRDNGLGIAAAHQPKLFKAFQRLHPNRAAGEGMGLAMVSRIVQRHRGRIWLESAVDVGTTFFVALPSSSKPPVHDDPFRDSQQRSVQNDSRLVSDCVS